MINLNEVLEHFKCDKDSYSNRFFKDHLSFRLWNDCHFDCPHCFNKYLKGVSPAPVKANMLEAIKSYIHSNPTKHIRLQGGEVSDVQLGPIRSEWNSFIDKLLEKKIEIFSIVTSLMSDQFTILEETIQKLSSIRVELYCSWDLYRDPVMLEELSANIIKLTNKYPNVVVHYSLTLSNELIKLLIENKAPVKIDENTVFNVPTPFIVDGSIEEAKTLTKNTVSGFFIERNLFISWVNKLIQNNEKEMLFNTIITGYLNDTLIYDGQKYVPKNVSSGLNTCGHSKMYQIYSDSDACCICDMFGIIG